MLVLRQFSALSVRPPTLSGVVKTLLRKRCVTRLRTVKDDRAMFLSLSRRGDRARCPNRAWVRQVDATLAEKDRRALGRISKGTMTSPQLLGHPSRSFTPTG